MALLMSPINKRDKERLRQLKLREDKGNKESSLSVKAIDDIRVIDWISTMISHGQRKY
jgi:hypothetical protein